MNNISPDKASRKRVSVVILNWNGRQLMEDFLPSVVRYSPSEITDVIVADNGSTDDSIAMLEKRFPSVGIIRLDRNYGFAEGYNQALKQIDTEITVLLNSDVEVSEGWLEAPLKAFDSDPDIACVQPKILSYRQKDHFEYAGAAGCYIDKYGYPFCRGRVLHAIEKDNGQYDTQADILWGSGASLFVRTEVYKKEGGLDAFFFAHQEEVDMCWRLRCRGYRLVCTPQSVVYHVGGATLEMESPRKTFLNFRNNLLMLYKNLPDKDLKRVMRIRFWLDYIAAAQFLLKGHLANAKAIHEARKAYNEALPDYKKIRDENRTKTVLQPIPELLNKSLILLFYLRGKKTFAAITGIGRK